MSYLIFVYLAFSVVVILRQEKSLNLLWFLMMPIGFSLALFGLMLFTEYIAYANFTENPLFISGNLLVWKINYYLDLSVFGMFRLMNLGIALYLLGAVGFPLSQQPNRLLLKRGVITMMIPALFIMLSDPELLQWIFTPDSVFQGMQNVLSGLNAVNPGTQLPGKSCTNHQFGTVYLVSWKNAQGVSKAVTVNNSWNRPHPCPGFCTVFLVSQPFNPYLETGYFENDQPSLYTIYIIPHCYPFLHLHRGAHLPQYCLQQF